MQTAKLGSEGPQLTRIGLGTWAIGGPGRYGWGPTDDQQSIDTIRRALRLGVNWLDTAPVYGVGHSETVVGRALSGLSLDHECYVCTKCGRQELPDGSVPGDLRPDTIRRECEISLRRLGRDHIDLYQIHWPDGETGTPVEDSWAAMAELVDRGLVRWIGVSNFDPDLLRRCEAIRHVDSLQPPVSMLRRQELDTSVRWAAEHGTGVIAYSPMESGLLTGTMTAARLAALDPQDVRFHNPEFQEPGLSVNLAIVDKLASIAAQESLSLPTLAVAWVLAQTGITGAIVGARQPQQLDAWMSAAEVDLSQSVLDAIAGELAQRQLV